MPNRKMDFPSRKEQKSIKIPSRVKKIVEKIVFDSDNEVTEVEVISVAIYLLYTTEFASVKSNDEKTVNAFLERMTEVYAEMQDKGLIGDIVYKLKVK